MAVVFPQGLEVFGNCSSCVATSTYGTTNPAAGTTEQWVMGTGYTSFPTATFNASTTFTNPSATPPGNYFYIRDPADTTNEIVLVYAGGGGTSTWYVQRGMNGATVAHASGATWVQVISPYTLQSFKQTPGNVSSAIVQTGTSSLVLASYTPLSAEVAAGTSWRVIAYAASIGWTAAPVQNVSLYWGGSGSVGGVYTPGTALASILTNTNATRLTPTTVTTNTSGMSMDVEGSITLITATTATCNMNMWYSTSTTRTTNISNASVVNNGAAGAVNLATPVTVSGNGPIFLVATWSGGTAPTATWTAPLIFRDT